MNDVKIDISNEAHIRLNECRYKLNNSTFNNIYSNKLIVKKAIWYYLCKFIEPLILEEITE